MLVVIVVEVAYPARFREVFGFQADARKERGEVSAEVFQSATEPNTMLVIAGWEAEAAAKGYWESSKGKEDIKTWGSVRIPKPD